MSNIYYSRAGSDMVYRVPRRRFVEKFTITTLSTATRLGYALISVVAAHNYHAIMLMMQMGIMFI